MEVGQRVKILFNGEFQYGIIVHFVSERIAAISIFYPRDKESRPPQYWVPDKSLLELNNLDRLLYL